MAHEIQFSDDYIRGLNRAIDNYWLVSVAAADRFAEAHDDRVTALMQFPRRGRAEPGGRFSLPIGKSGYRIVYEMKDEVVVLLNLTNVRQRRR